MVSPRAICSQDRLNLASTVPQQSRVSNKTCRPKTNPQVLMTLGGLGYKSLTMSYFHRCTSTIIGAKVFHGPVRDGKEWDHLAMVVKRSLLNG